MSIKGPQAQPIYLSLILFQKRTISAALQDRTVGAGKATPSPLSRAAQT